MQSIYLMKTKRICQSLISAAALSLGAALIPGATVFAADHGDGPTIAYDQAADIADVYFFLDPNDTARAVLIGTTHGFIVPGEASNFGTFDPVIRYRFEVYSKHVNVDPPAPTDKSGFKKYLNTVKPDKFIDVTFSPRIANPGPAGAEALQVLAPQTATLQFTGFSGINKKTKFTADATNPTLGSTELPATITRVAGDAAVDFFAGETDDPFFFDVPAFSAFIKSVRDGAPNGGVFSRGRDTFAGYNVMTIAISIPAALLRDGVTGDDKVGLNFLTQRHFIQSPTKDGTVKGVAGYKTIDREGNPAVNAVLIPANRKNKYNVATPKDDASLIFALDEPTKKGVAGEPGLLTVFANLGVVGGPFDGFGASSAGTLAALAVLHGDVLTLNTNPAAAPGFPNGRRVQDDVVDTLLSVVSNGALTPQTSMAAGGDNVLGNDVPFRTVFPFVAPPQQPRASGVDDNTRN